jgi:hypothetical protein
LKNFAKLDNADNENLKIFLQGLKARRKEKKKE